MKIFVLVIVMFVSFLPCGLYAQTAQLEWAKRMGGALNDQATEITVDGSGNVYTTGGFAGEVDFNPGTGVFNLNSNNGNIFISKLDASGNFIWAKQMTMETAFIHPRIATDDFGYIYIAGSFKGTVDLDPGDGVYNLGGGDTISMFITKLNLSGEFAWAKHFAGIYGGIVYSIEVDNTGNVYTSGEFSHAYDFDPGMSEFILTGFGGSGQRDIFISKLDPLGNFVWAKQLGGIGNDHCYSMSLDTSGNVYTTGRYFSKADFNPGADTFNLTSNGSATFVSKLNAAGDFVLAKQIAGEHISGIAVDNNENIVITGDFFKDEVDFDPSAGIFNLSTAGSYDGFILKLDNSGEFIWAKSIGGSSDEVISTIDTDVSGNIYVNGFFYSMIVDMDPGADESLLKREQGSTFILKLDSSGNFVWVKQLEKVNDFAKTVVDKFRNVYTTGGFGVYTGSSFEGTADFDPESGVYNLTSAGGYDVFIQKLSQTTSSITEYPLNELGSAPFPNPSSGKISIQNPFKNTKKAISIAVYTIEGELLKEYTSISEDKLQIDLSKVKSGVYAIKLASGKEVYVAKVTIIR